MTGLEFWIPFALSQAVILGTLLYKMGQNTASVALQIKHLDEKIDSQETRSSHQIVKIETDLEKVKDDMSKVKDRVTWTVSKLGGGLEVNP